ncbi:MAG: peptidylprolyl isomerase [Sphingomonadaceae bacterium]
MIRTLASALALTAAFWAPLPLTAQEPQALAPGEIVTRASAEEWVAIPAEDLLVMTLAPDADGNPRQVVIQLMPPPFSEGWVHNIRLFARSGWYDGISVNRVQDNYVVQWGDPNYDNPEASGQVKTLPEGLKVMGGAEYIVSVFRDGVQELPAKPTMIADSAHPPMRLAPVAAAWGADTYAPSTGFWSGWPLGISDQSNWPIHCYGMVGVGRNYSPDTGSGAELYTVIGHAPRHLDRNIALVGRVIEGMEHLSSLPRGRGELGFYAAHEVAKRTPILTVRVASDLTASAQPRFEYLSTDSDTFSRYADARANRRDPFFIVPAGGADICNIPVPVRRLQVE